MRRLWLKTTEDFFDLVEQMLEEYVVSNVDLASMYWIPEIEEIEQTFVTRRNA